MDDRAQNSLIPQEYRDILPPSAVRAIETRLLHMIPEDREDALQEAAVAYLCERSPSAAVKVHADREARHRKREVTETKLKHP